MRKSTAFPALLALTLLTPATTFAADENNSFKGITNHMVVAASPQVCYDAIQALRKQTPTEVKEISRADGQCILQETFKNLPFVGKAVCIYEEKYVPGKSIEYKMINSDRFRAFEGKWELVGSADGKETDVRLSSLVLLDLPIPFLRQLTNTQTARGVKERLNAVKKLAETNQAQLSNQGITRSEISTVRTCPLPLSSIREANQHKTTPQGAENRSVGSATSSH